MESCCMWQHFSFNIYSNFKYIDIDSSHLIWNLQYRYIETKIIGSPRFFKFILLSGKNWSYVSTKFYCENALNHHCMNFIIYRNKITKLMKKKICKLHEWNLKNVTYLKWESTLQHYVKLYRNVWKSCNIAH